MKLVLVTFVAAKHEGMGVFSQEVQTFTRPWGSRIPERVGEVLPPTGAPTTVYHDATGSRPRPFRAEVAWASERSSG
jgi:hypothetical protein